MVGQLPLRCHASASRRGAGNVTRMTVNKPKTRRLSGLAPLLLATLAACAAPPETPPSAPVAGTSPATEARLGPAELREDLDQLYTTLQAAHFDLYARLDKPAYDAAYSRLREQLDQAMTRSEALLAFQRFVALGRVAHARIDLPFERWATFREGGGKALGFTLRVRDGEVFVLSEFAGTEGIAPGDRVLAIDGEAALDWLDRMGTLVSADNDYLRHAQMENLLPALAWFTLGEVGGVRLTLATADGGRREAWLPATTRAQLAAAEASAPATRDLSGREARMLDGRIAYLRPGPFYDDRPEASSPWDRSHFRAFIDQAFEDFIAAGATDLVLDLRDNPGGNNSFSDLVLAWFADRPFRFSDAFEIRVSEATTAANQARLAASPGDAGSDSANMAALFESAAPGSLVRYEIPLVQPRPAPRFEGRVHVLVNRHSYSNAVSVAAMVQDLGFGRVLGEETADLASTLGAMEHFTLSHSGLTVGYPKARMLRPSGDPAPRGVVPDVAIAHPIPEGPEDPVLQAALREVRRAAAASGKP